MFQREAGLLSNLKNIYVPILYDCEEDEEYWYLIQEYVTGQSMKDLRRQKNLISQKELTELAIKICDAMISLHSSKPNPVLYLDLKPEHIVLTGERVKLLDLGSAMYLRGSELMGTLSGTKGFAAPEQLQGGRVDCRSDIYSIGAVLYWLMTGETAGYEGRRSGIRGYSKEWNAILNKCLECDKRLRYESVSHLQRELRSIVSKNGTQLHQSMKIAVVGSQSRVGVTHFCIGMALCCRKDGRTCLYEEKNDSGAVQQIFESTADAAEQDGIYYIQGMEAIPRYGQAVAQEAYSHQIILWDCGFASEMEDSCLEEADYIIAIAGGKEWEVRRTKELVERYRQRGNMCYVLRMGAGHSCKGMVRQLGIAQAFSMPEYGQTFQVTGTERRFYRKVLDYLMHHR